MRQQHAVSVVVATDHAGLKQFASADQPEYLIATPPSPHHFGKPDGGIWISDTKG